MSKKIFIILGFLSIILAGCSSTGVAISTDFNETVDIVDGNVPVTLVSTVTPVDYQLLVSTDKATGVQAQVYSAHNPDVDNSGSKEDIWEGGDLLTYLDVAQEIEIVSTDADDTDGGTGAWGVFLICLDENWDFAQELIPLNGQTSVTSTIKCIRPRSINVIQAGSSGYNEGTITATSKDTGDLQDVINPEESTSKNVHISVPRGYTLVLNKLLLSTTRTGGGQSPIVEFKGKVKLGNILNASWIQTFDVKIDTELNDHIILDNFIQNELNEYSDYRIEVTTTADNTDVNARLWWYFINNSAYDAETETLAQMVAHTG